MTDKYDSWPFFLIEIKSKIEQIIVIHDIQITMTIKRKVANQTLVAYDRDLDLQFSKFNKNDHMLRISGPIDTKQKQHKAIGW